MTCHFEKNGTSLTARPEGRLDTATTPVFEQQLETEMEGMTDIIIDFEKIEYVSSGGLRVLLNTEQEMEECGGSLKVIHVNDAVMEILRLVGFTDILTIE